MDALNTTATSLATNGGRQIPMPETSISQTPRYTARKASTDMANTKPSIDTKPLWEQNAKIIALLIAVLTLIGLVYGAASKFAAYEFKIDQLEKKVEKLEQKDELYQERRITEALEKAKISGYEIGKTENKK